jgi:hypothetical protein
MVMRTFHEIVRGVEAGALGTHAMDTLLYRRYRDGGGESTFLAWESTAGVSSWERAPAPALVAKRLLERVTKSEVPPRYARILNNLTHWGFGLATGAGYGLLVGSRKRRVWYGLPFGAAVWAGGYVVLPLLGVYQPIWKCDLETLEKDLSAHLVFGTATAAAFACSQTGERPNHVRQLGLKKPGEVPATTTDVTTESTTRAARTPMADMKFEVVVIPVADADRSKEFYDGLGWRLDADFAFDNDFRVVQFTPPGSAASIQFGSNITAAAPRSARGCTWSSPTLKQRATRSPVSASRSARPSIPEHPVRSSRRTPWIA